MPNIVVGEGGATVIHDSAACPEWPVKIESSKLVSVEEAAFAIDDGVARACGVCTRHLILDRKGSHR